MATPTAPSKRYYAAATAKATTWGTATATGANCGILLLGDSGLARNQKFEPYPAIDQIIPQDGILGIQGAPEFTPPVHLQYEVGPIGSWLAALYGTAGEPANNANAYTHTFQWANSVDEFFTYAEERPGHIWEVPSAIPFKAVIKPDGAQIRAEIALRGNTLIDDSTVNNAAVMDAVTYISRTNFLHLSQGEFRMNTQSGGALGANDAIQISDFEISIERALDNVHAVGSVNIIQPVEGDIPNATLKITLPRASNTNLDYFSTWEDMAAQKVTLSFTGSEIGSTGANYSVTFYFPRLMLVSPPDVKLEGVMKNELVFTMQEASSAPTGMNYARPYIQITNGTSTDYLA